MTNRYIIASDTWRKHDRRYVVLDTHNNDAWVLQTNDHAKAIKFRNELNAEQRAEQRVADRIDGYDRDDLGESPDY